MNYLDEIHYWADKGMAGWFALIYDGSGPIQTGCGRYETRKEALEEAYEWAICDSRFREADRIAKELAL